MGIAGIGNSSLSVNFSAINIAAGTQAASSVGGNQSIGGLDPLLVGSSIAGALNQPGSQGNSSVNSVNALATALLIGAIAGGEEEDKKKSAGLAGAAVALLAYQSIMGLGQSSSLGVSSGALTAGAVNAVGSFSAMA